MNPRRARTPSALRLVGYVRVSHVGGRNGDRFHSPDDQAAAIRAWCDRHGHRVDIAPPELDASGGDHARPILGRAVAAVEAGEYNGLVVAYGSRLARDVQIMLDVSGRIEAVGGRYVDVSLDIDTSTPEGRMMRTTLAAHDQMVLDRFRDGFAALRRTSTAEGIWQRRQTPTGYDRDPATRRLVPNGDAEKVRRAFERRAAGAPVVAIADELGMTPAGARRLLRNRVYLGELAVGECRNPHAHEPIVAPDLFDAAQVDRPRPARIPGRRAALLAGVIRCATCGHAMTRSGGAGGATYRCAVHHSGVRCPNPAGVVCDRVEAFVEQVVLRELLKRTTAEGRLAHEQLEDLAAAEQAAEAELRAYVTATAAAKLGAGVFAEGLAVRQAAVERAAAALTAERDRHAAADILERGIDAWGRLDPSARNAVLRATLDAVAVGPVGRGRRVPVAERVAVFPVGSGVELLPVSNGAGVGLRPLDVDDPRALRVG